MTVREWTDAWSREWGTVGIGFGLFLGPSVVLRLPDLVAGTIPLFFETATPHTPWDSPPPPLVSDLVAEASTEGAGRLRWSTLSQTERLFRHVQ